ncbi:hypothetical protein CRD60_06940 [Bifidobacterium aemilianum]|uniref:ABC3 transporter permease C-terminal domain-containing protein n=1 Tax=Bifidobacterium aemilianum TaxID=2493120 RepID=A0A366K6I8_9BIFI|nr:FtsX-like permease family protein [Bifidobacterium aemilianum]RBP97356.1 hypothetical protein CRD60_06940 [Bifidobacterium aemilianum]
MDAQFYLKNPKDLYAFHTELTAKGLPKDYKVTTDASAYKKLTAPVESLQKLATVFLVLVIVLGAVVLLFVSLMNMRSRTYEIGVLRAIGMKKGKVSAGLISEVLVMVAVCLLAGLGVGYAATQPVAESMLQGQQTSYEQQQKDSEEGPEGGVVFQGLPGQSDAPKDVKPTKIAARMDGKSLGQIVGISLDIVVLASAVSVTYITRMEPRRILAQGN